MRIRYRTAGAELQAHIVDELATVLPEGRIDPTRFQFNLYEDDPRLAQILKILDRHGINPTPRGGTSELGKEYLLEHWRDYHDSDLADVRYFRIRPAAEGNGLFRDEMGRVEMIDAQFPRRGHIVRTPLFWIVVPERVKAAIEREGFRGVAFRETVLVGGHALLSKMTPRPWSRHGEPWWELTSDVVLPPMSPTMELYDEHGDRVVNADCSRGCSPREGLFVHPEYRYRRSDLAPIEPFDFARTAERFGRAGHVDTWHYIASTGFRECCVGHKWRCDWIPVRVEG